MSRLFFLYQIRIIEALLQKSQILFRPVDDFPFTCLVCYAFFLVVLLLICSCLLFAFRWWILYSLAWVWWGTSWDLYSMKKGWFDPLVVYFLCWSSVGVPGVCAPLKLIQDRTVMVDLTPMDLHKGSIDMDWFKLCFSCRFEIKMLSKLIASTVK